MLNKASRCVLTSLRGSAYSTKYDSPPPSLRSCLANGASWRPERVG